MKTSDPLENIREASGSEDRTGPISASSAARSATSPTTRSGTGRGYPTWPRTTSSAPTWSSGSTPTGSPSTTSTARSSYCSLGEDRSELVAPPAQAKAEMGSLDYGPRKPNITKERYEKMVEKAKEYIAAGDIFQVVPSKRHDFEVTGDLARFYSELSRINPSPYMYFLKFGDRRIVGSSPEMLLRVEDRKVETFPIAGTAPRVPDKKENDRHHQGAARRPEGEGRARDARRPREERHREGRQVRQRQGP